MMNEQNQKDPVTEEEMNEQTSATPDSQNDQHLKLEGDLILARKENFELKRNLDEARKKNYDYESKIGEIREFVKKLEQEIELVKERALRDQEKEVERRFTGFLIPFLEVLDNFERSFDSSSEESSSFVEGMRLVYKQILSSLERLGVQKMTSLSQAFDPNLHEAVTMISVESAEEDMKVKNVLRDGYLFGERVLRPAQVIVGKAQ